MFFKTSSTYNASGWTSDIPCNVFNRAFKLSILFGADLSPFTAFVVNLSYIVNNVLKSSEIIWQLVPK